MKLNCDLGESFGAWTMGMDEKVMPFVDMANIACGFHASDPQIMSKTVLLAQTNKVEIGAHPAYPDLVGFGRRSMSCTPEEVESMLLYQIGALDGICRAYNCQVRYVKPHGALYNDMMADPNLLNTVMKTVSGYGGVDLVIPATVNFREHLKQAERLRLTLRLEAFCDRAYDDRGQLLLRKVPGSVLKDTDDIIRQASDFAEKGGVTTVTGQWLPLPVDTLCIHGDNEESIRAASAIRAQLGSRL